MITYILAAFFFVIIVVGMSIGVLAGRKPIKGSCGGLSSLGMSEDCKICNGNKKACRRALADSA